MTQAMWTVVGAQDRLSIIDAAVLEQSRSDVKSDSYVLLDSWNLKQSLRMSITLS